MSGKITPIEYSIIIPICHGGELLRDALSSLANMDASPGRFEVLVPGPYHDMPSRNIILSAARDAAFDVVYIRCADSCRSHLLNQACGAARGRILAFADDDCIFMKNWLNTIRETFSLNAGVGIVGGPDAPEQNTSSFYLSLDSVLNSFLGTGGLRRGNGARAGKYYPKLWNMAVPKDVAFDVAPKSGKSVRSVFNESISVHEDVELAKRIEQSGKIIWYEPNMRIRHQRNTTFFSYTQRNFKMAQVCRKFRIHTLPHIVLSALAIGLPLALLAAVFGSSTIQWAALLFAASYIIALLPGAVQGYFRTKRIRVLALIPLLMLALHLSRGFGFFWPNGK